MKGGSAGDKLDDAFASLREVPAPDGERQAAGRAALLARASRLRAAVPRKPSGFLALMPALSTRQAVAGAAIAIIVVLALGAGGVIYAAEGAAPGDPLYGIDRAVESARLHFTSEPQAAMELLLSLAEERLLEAEKLSGEGDAGNLERALSGYGATVSTLARTFGEVSEVSGGEEEEALAAVIDQSLSAHEARLAGLLQDENGDGEEEEEEEAGDSCVGADPHPRATKLAEEYGADYDEIMGWFCDDNFGFGEIMHALETSKETGEDAKDLLDLKTELGGWGRVWQFLGLIGRPEAESAGSPDDQPPDTAAGPPEDKPGGQPAGRPVGPPEDKPGGQPSGRPVGPPEDKPGGPPEGEPGAPPDDEEPPDADEPSDDEEPPDAEEPPDDEEPPDEEADSCVGADPHPRATKLAEEYDADYDEIMTWFCEDRFGFGEIMLALRTSQKEGIEESAEELLELKRELGGWGKVLQQLGLIGKPAKEKEPGGPPKDKSGGPPEDKPGGRPEDKPSPPGKSKGGGKP